MSEPVIPEKEGSVILQEPSEAVKAQRGRVSIAAEAVFVVGQTGCKAREAARAVELMTYLDELYVAECKKLDGIIASEALGQPVQVDGTKLSLVETR